uniref:hypothetical protein n=1 Tax=Ornithobacterium rhinotracheale TaxID=28251 RepID=UPI0039A4AF78
MATMFLVAVGCFSGSEQKEPDFDLEGAFDGFAKNITLQKDFSMPIRAEKASEDIQKYLLEADAELSEAMKEDDYVDAVSYKVAYDGKNLNFVDFKTEEKTISSRVAKGGAASEYDWSCPGGQRLVTTCMSQGCVEKELKELAKKMNVGDEIVIHRSRFKVEICTTIKD